MRSLLVLCVLAATVAITPRAIAQTPGASLGPVVATPAFVAWQPVLHTRAPDRALPAGRAGVAVAGADADARRSRSIWRGVVIGGLTTAVLGALITAMTCGTDDGHPGRSCTGVIARNAVVAFPVGAIIGAGLASLGGSGT